MGLIERLGSSRVYLDTNIFIYIVEKVPESFPALADLFPAIDRGDLTAVTSELTLAEVLVKPLADGNHDLVADYLNAIRPRAHLEVVPVSRAILVEAARFRGEIGIKLPDAIHAASARAAGCACFVTNDESLTGLPEVDVVLASSL